MQFKQAAKARILGFARFSYRAPRLARFLGKPFCESPLRFSLPPVVLNLHTQLGLLDELFIGETGSAQGFLDLD